MSTADIALEPKAKTFGMIGVIVGFLGLLSVLVGPVIRDAIIPPPPPESPRQRISAQELPDTLSFAFAALAIIGGAVSYLRREDHRYAYVACGIGTATLVWHALLLALAVAVLCVILAYVLPDALS